MKAAIAETAEKFGGIDILVNNASAINLADTAQIEMKRFDLMHQVNARGTFMVTKFALPYLEKAQNPHVLMLSPPLDMQPRWFAPHLAYTMAKFGMSLCVLGFAAEFPRARHSRQRALAAHHDRDGGDQKPARRRGGDARLAQARDSGRRGVADLPEAGARIYRENS